jgi:hypothetical protein
VLSVMEKSSMMAKERKGAETAAPTVEQKNVPRCGFSLGLVLSLLLQMNGK